MVTVVGVKRLLEIQVGMEFYYFRSLNSITKPFFFQTE